MEPWTRFPNGTPYLVAFCIAAVTVLTVNGSFRMTSDGPIRGFEWIVVAVEMLLVAVPFLLLAFLKVRGRTPWLVGMGLTFGLWGYFAYEVLVHHDENYGVDMGLGLVMLASPIIISAICLIAGRRELRR